uniref:Putative secreted protein n=1 Tax=Rhipicephalus microplus TaxID=6941 RepID=A0A6G5A1D4_RHIMP
MKKIMCDHCVSSKIVFFFIPVLCILVGQGENANCLSLRNMETQGLLVDALKVQCTCHATVDNASAMRWLSHVMFYHCLHQRVKCKCFGICSQGFSCT